MGEAIAALVELVVSLVMLVAEAIPLILELLVTAVVAALTLVGYALSPRFRRKKRQRWEGKPRKKYLDLGLSSACVGLVIGFGAWLAWASPKPARDPVLVADGPEEELRFTIKNARAEGATKEINVVVKKGGARKIIETGSLKEIGKAVRENVTVIRPPNEPERGASTKETVTAK